MEDFFKWLFSIVGIIVILAWARESTKGKYLGYGFRWKPIPGYRDPKFSKSKEINGRRVRKLP